MLKSAILSSLLLLSASACVVGAPPGFSSGDLWTVPLVAPLENGQFLVPVTIQGEGPFLFLVDPDSPESSIESSIASSLKLYTYRAPLQRQTEADHLVRIGIAEVKKMTIGTLSIRSMKMRVHTDRSYWSGGRRVHGILGRDVISDSLIYHFDRDVGLMYIATQGHLKVPEGAKSLSFTQSYGNHRRYIAKMSINDKHTATMHMDLGAPSSMLWAHLLDKYKLPKVPTRANLIDEYGFRRQVTKAGIASFVSNRETKTNAIMMLPYDDRRLEKEDLDGIIGQNFWSKYNVTVNWHEKKFWLQERSTDLAANATERLARWGNQLAGCGQPACVTATLQVDKDPNSEAPGTVPAGTNTPATDPSDTDAAEPTPAPTTPAPTDAVMPTTAPGFAPPITPVSLVVAPPLAPQYSLKIDRDPKGREFAYDVVVAAVDDQGRALRLPTFLVSFGVGVAELKWPTLDAAYADAANFVVIDMNPVGTRGCEGAQCIFQLPVRW